MTLLKTIILIKLYEPFHYATNKAIRVRGKYVPWPNRGGIPGFIVPAKPRFISLNFIPIPPIKPFLHTNRNSTDTTTTTIINRRPTP